MNRLILVGNGFDLAHGLPTSYTDFIHWYINQCFIGALNGVPNDDLIEISTDQRYEDVVTNNIIEQWVSNSFKKGFDDITTLGKPNLHYTNQYVYPFKVSIKSAFLKALLDQCKVTRWVDVEAIFYEQLISILDPKKESRRSERDQIVKDEALLKKLNDDMRVLVSQLEKYLLSIASPAYISGYEEILASLIKAVDLDSTPPILLPNEVWVNHRPVATHILNFNYTNTIEQYIKKTKKSKLKEIEVNYIHGKLQDIDNPIVFGFGDELDDRYLEMERQKAKGYFEHIKSFWYFRTLNYKNLVRFTEVGDYQVYVLGHSCGLSDRTMLNMVLEHRNCRSVKIYFHGDKEKNNYTDITYEIARHFKGKVSMRDKIVSTVISERMPQVDDQNTNNLNHDVQPHRVKTRKTALDTSLADSGKPLVK